MPRSYYTATSPVIMAQLSSIDRTYLELIARDWHKYLGFILGMRGLSLLGARGKLLERYYVFMRHADDVADRDAATPDGSAPVDYLERKREYARTLGAPTDDAEQLYLEAMELADRIGISLSQETGALLDSLLFDARRYSSGSFFSRDELERYYVDRDIEGTGRGMLKILGDDPERVDLLRPLCIATRLHYDICDFEIDVAKGFVNVPREDAERLGIRAGELSRDNPAVRRLFGEQARRGLALLRQHAHNQRAFNTTCRAVFRPFYVLPCERSLRRFEDW